MSQQRLYDTDFYAWTQDQAAKLREVRDNRLDAANLAEEVADLGRSELRAVEAHLLQLFVHMLKAAFSPAEAPRAGWRGEIRQHQLLLRKAFSPSMRAKIDLAELWTVARETASDHLVQYGEAPIPNEVGCPFDFDTLVVPDFDVDRAIRKLAPGV